MGPLTCRHRVANALNNFGSLLVSKFMVISEITTFYYRYFFNKIEKQIKIVIRLKVPKKGIKITFQNYSNDGDNK